MQEGLGETTRRGGLVEVSRGSALPGSPSPTLLPYLSPKLLPSVSHANPPNPPTTTVEQTELSWLLASSGRGGSFMTAVVSTHHKAGYSRALYSTSGPPPCTLLHKGKSPAGLDGARGPDDGEDDEPPNKLWLCRQPSEETAVSDEDSLYGDDHGSQLSQSPSSSLGSSPCSDVSCAVVDKRVVARTKTAQDIRLRFASKLGIPNPKRRSREETAARRLSCLPEGYEPVFEKLKGQVDTYGGFLRLMRRSNAMVHEPSVATTTTNPPTSPPSSSTSCPCPTPADARNDSPLQPSTGGCVGTGKACTPQAYCSNRSSSSSSNSPSPCGGGAFCTPTKKTAGGLRKKVVSSPEAGGVRGGGAIANRSPIRKKVNFSEAVRVVRIPSHADYSRRVREQYWSTAEDIYEMACRNLVEFDMEGHDWENVAEEHQMVWCEEAGELIHPAHFEVYDETPIEQYL